MCGICGLYNQERPIDEHVLAQMTFAMQHRGPDDEGYFVDRNIGLGFRRLSIVDIEHGHQPMANENQSVWVVFNGEIYNHQALRQDLIHRGHSFASESDTEVIVHLFEEYGIDCVTKLQGMFAFAVVDLTSRRLYLARDHFGIKPLYYASTPEGVLFASEMKPILKALGGATQINLQAVWDYLTLQYIPSDQCIMKGIEKLAPGHYAQIQDGRLVSTRRYWLPEYQPDETKGLSYFVEGVESHLSESVKRHLQGSVPIGSFLSGGVDSNTIAALIRRSCGLKTFSVGFHDSPASLMELSQAEAMARELGTTHHSLVVSKEEYMRRLPEALSALEEPLGDPSAIGLYLVSELARQHVTVVLSGEGADEIFAGYPIYHEAISLRPMQFLPKPMQSLIARLAPALPYGLKGRDYLIRGSQPIERRFLGNIRAFSEDAKLGLVSEDLISSVERSTYGLSDEIYHRTETLDDVTRMQLVDLQTWMPGDILFKADKMTMAHSLELRVPFLDKALFDFASTIPLRYRIHHGEGKHVLRQAARRVLPVEATARPKLGFPIPYRKWMKDNKHLLLDRLQCSPMRYWFNMSTIERMIRLHQQDSRDFGRELWILFALAEWERALAGWSKADSQPPHALMNL